MSLAAIRKLYFNTSKATVQKDLTKAIALFKALTSEEAARLAANLWDATSAQRQFDRGNAEYSGRGGDPRKFDGTGPTEFVASANVVAQANAMLNPSKGSGGGGGSSGGGGRSGGGGGGGGGGGW